MKMKKTTIYLEESHIAQLKEESSSSELIRNLLDAYLEFKQAEPGASKYVKVGMFKLVPDLPG